MIVTGEGAAVGLNGGFVHTVQLGANCLPGTECQAWNETNSMKKSWRKPVPGSGAMTVRRWADCAHPVTNPKKKGS